MAAKVWSKERGAWGVMLKYMGFFGGDENILKLTAMMVVRICENTKNHLIVHFKWVACMVYKLSQ